MKLRIPRRIKVEEESSDSDNEEAAATTSTEGSVQDQTKDKVPAVTSKAATVSPITINKSDEIASLRVETVFKVELVREEVNTQQRALMERQWWRQQ